MSQGSCPRGWLLLHYEHPQHSPSTNLELRSELVHRSAAAMWLASCIYQNSKCNHKASSRPFLFFTRSIIGSIKAFFILTRQHYIMAALWIPKFLGTSSCHKWAVNVFSQWTKYQVMEPINIHKPRNVTFSSSQDGWYLAWRIAHCSYWGQCRSRWCY